MLGLEGKLAVLVLCMHVSDRSIFLDTVNHRILRQYTIRNRYLHIHALSRLDRSLIFIQTDIKDRRHRLMSLCRFDHFLNDLPEQFPSLRIFLLQCFLGDLIHSKCHVLIHLTVI